LKIRFGSGDGERPALKKSEEPGVVQISSVQNVERTRLERENVEDSSIVRFLFFYMDKGTNCGSQFEQAVVFDGSFPFSRNSPMSSILCFFGKL